jgi:hypothetical protein
MRLLPEHLEHLTLRELVDITSELLGSMRIEQRDGRATARPDARAVRYYISLGLVDRPLGYRGTSALYGERHVLQILASKVLQSKGHTLPAIQQQLLGRDDRALAALLPPVLPPSASPVTPIAPTGSSILVSIPVRPGVTVQIDPSVLADARGLQRLVDDVARAVRAAAGSLSTVSSPNPPAKPVSKPEESS